MLPAESLGLGMQQFGLPKVVGVGRCPICKGTRGLLAVPRQSRRSNPVRDDRYQKFAWCTRVESRGGLDFSSGNMKLDKRERARPNVAGLVSRVQLAEMDLLLAGRWPALKPLPVFRYETGEYRATIHFDKSRGEWVCRKTNLVTDKTQEMRKDLERRGGLTEMTMALPHGEPLAPSEEGAEETQELASVDNLHAEAVREWKENYANGAVYSQLQEYLSEGQQEEVYDIVRMSLTAWQLQFNPKNIAFIFDALWNASGKLAMLLEIARRKKIERDAGTSCEGISISPVESAEAAIAEQSGEINLQQAPLAVPELRESMAPEGGERSAPANIAGVAAELSADAFAEEVRTPSRERIAAPRSRSSAVIAPEILGASRWSFVEKFEEKTLDEIPYFGFRGFRRRAPKSKIEGSPRAVEESPAEDLESEKSAKKGIGLRVAAIVFLVVGFSVGFTVGLNTPAVPPETEEPRPESPTSTAQPAVLAPVSPASSATLVKPTGPSTAVISPSHADSDRSSGAPIRNEATAEERESRESPRDANSFARVPSREPDAAPATESRRTSELARGSERDSSSGLDARNAWPPAHSESAYTREGGREFSGATRGTASGVAKGAARGTLRGTSRGTTRSAARIATRSAAARRGAFATRTAPRAGAYAPSTSAILVTAPAQGSRSLKLTFPEKPIAVSSSFAITSQLSVLVAPEPGPAVAHHPARLQAGKLVSYVWPRYPKDGSREESSETVKLRATIGKFGQVMDVKRVNGSSSLSAAAMSAIRQWHFQPTLLNERPVQSQQDVTIEFRPPRYLTQVSTRHSSPN